MQPVSSEVEIDATPEEIWTILMDTRAYPQWNTMILKLNGPFKVGKTHNGLLGLGPKLKLPFFPKVLTLDNQTEVRWKGGPPGILTADHRILIEPGNAGRTRVRHHEEFTGLVPKFSADTTTQATKRIHGRFNAALKKRAEAVNPS